MSLPPRLLAMLARLHERRRDTSAAALRRADQARRQAEQTATMLARFEQDQFARRRAAVEKSLGVSTLRVDDGFHRKLAQARALQDGVRDTAQQAATDAREALAVEQRRLQALETLQHRQQRRELLAALRKEQRESDERNGRRHAAGAADPHED